MSASQALPSVRGRGSEPAPSDRDPSARPFAAFCAASYLLCIAYGTTFLLASLVVRRGGDEAHAGLIISSAMLSTLVSVIASGHLADRWGAVRSIAVAGGILAISCAGFALIDSIGAASLGCALLLGIGWGAFYTLGPIVVADIVPPQRRMRRFALLSGCMMSGIGSGPLIGRWVDGLGWAPECAWWAAAAAAMGGSLAFFRLIDPVQALPGGASPVAARLAFGSARLVLRSKALAPIVMVGLGGAVFGGMSSFQTSYATERSLDYATYFVGFMAAAIGGRLFLSARVARAEPAIAAFWLTTLMAVSIGAFVWLDGAAAYLLASIGLGIGYGLTYSIINALAANRAPEGLTSQALIVFSLAYLIGAFGFPLIGGWLLTVAGTQALMAALTGLAVLEAAIALGMWRRVRVCNVASP